MSIIKTDISLRHIILAVFISAIVANILIIFLDVHHRDRNTLIGLDITAGIASALGIVGLLRHKVTDYHARSYLSLTVGLILWLIADIIITYYFVVLGLREEALTSIADVFWLTGYVFFAAHLFITLKFIRLAVNSSVIIISSIVSITFLLYSVIHCISESQFKTFDDLIDFSVNTAYPVLDSILIVPAITVFVTLRKDYLNSFPWLLASLSLLVNAIADHGIVNYSVSGNLDNIWIWDLFFITDYLILAGALFWFNKYHIPHRIILEG